MADTAKGATPDKTPRKRRPPLTPAEQEVIAYRREKVAHFRLQRMTQRQIQQALAEAGYVSPDSKEPWSLGTINSDIQALRREWKAAAKEKTDTLRGELLAELRAVRQAAWGGAVDRKTLDTLADMLKDSSAMVRAEALKALAALAQPNLSAVLASAKQEADLIGLEAPKKLDVDSKVAQINFNSDDATKARDQVKDWQAATFGGAWDPTAPPPG